jgi:putative copper export protein
MSNRDGVALAVCGVGLGVLGLGCVVTFGVLREYADVCGETGSVVQVWLGGAGLGPLVAVVVAVLAILVAVTGGRRMRCAAAGLVVLAVLSVTVSGAAGVARKKSAYREDPATYGSCSGYNE